MASQKDQYQQPLEQKGVEASIPQLYWALRVQEKISAIEDSQKKQELQAELDRYYALLQLQGLYE